MTIGIPTDAPRRIALVGNAAGGKSTLARRLETALGLPRLEIDHIQWLPGWQVADPAEVTRKHDGFLAAHPDAWIIDGWGPWPTIARRLELAGAVVFVDLPIWQHYHHAAERQLALQRGEPATTPPGCDLLTATGPLFETIWRVHNEHRPRVLAMLAELPAARVHHVQSPAALAELALTWLGKDR